MWCKARLIIAVLFVLAGPALLAIGGERLSGNEGKGVLDASTEIAVIQETYRALAEEHPSAERAVKWLLDAIDKAKADKKPEVVKKHLVSLSLLQSWVNRPDFDKPPVAKLPHERRKGEKLDLLVYGPIEDYASFPSITRSEDRIILCYDVQPVSVLPRIEIHPHYQVLSGPCWTLSEDGGQSWRTTRTRPEYGKVVHAARSLRHLAAGAGFGQGNLRHSFGDDFEFGPFDYAACADGSLLAAGTGFPDPDKPKAIVFARSEDKGLTWAVVSQLTPTDVLGGYTEPALYVGRDGRAICVIRTKWDSVPPEQWPAGVRDHHMPNASDPDVWGRPGNRGEPGYGWYFYQSESTDHGRTWSTPASNGIWGHPANILRLSSGEVMMAYGHRKAPWSVRAILSHDDGRTWDMESMRTLRGFSPCLTDFGYPVVTQLPDGTIVCAFYGYSTADTSVWASPHGIFVSLFDEQWLGNGSDRR